MIAPSSGMASADRQSNIAHQQDKSQQVESPESRPLLAGAKRSFADLLALATDPATSVVHSRREGGQQPGGAAPNTNGIANADLQQPITSPPADGLDSAADPADPAVAANPVPDSPTAPASDPDSRMAVHRAIAAALQIDVLGELESGAIKIFSGYHRKLSLIQDIPRLKYERLIQHVGAPALQHVSPASSEAGMFTVSQVRTAIAYLAGHRTIGEETELGAGCWEGLAETGERYPSIVLVGPKEAAEFNGDGKLRKVTHPRCRGHLLDLSSKKKPWYDFDKLSGYLDQCDRSFAEKTIDDCVSLFDRWRWKSQATAPIVITGLVISSWVQTLWEWRPQVAVSGASKAGKSTFFKCLVRMFGSLALRSGQSSAAGIRQAIKSSARIIIADEFEKKAKHREEILTMLRSSGQGDVILRGTTNQNGLEFGLRHMAWVGAIEIGLRDAADRNRFLMLDLLLPLAKDRGRLRVPPESELADLGQRTLAVAIRYILRAREIAADLKGHQFAGFDDRIIEGCTVPAAILAAVQESNTADAIKLMEGLLEAVSDESSTQADEPQLLSDILSQHIFSGRETKSVGQLLSLLLSNPNSRDADDAEQALAKCGLKLDRYTEHDPVPRSMHGDQCLVLAYGPISDHLLKRTDWEGKSINQILARLPQAISTRRRVGGVRYRAVLVPRQFLDDEFFGDGPAPGGGNGTAAGGGGVMAGAAGGKSDSSYSTGAGANDEF